MAAKTYYERRGFRLALQTYLETAGYTGTNAVSYREGFRSEQPIIPPTVSITIINPRKATLELAPDSNLYRRTFQVDAYMESEERAMSICDLVMDFMDLIPIAIIDENNNGLGSLICYDTDSIVSDVLPPILTNPKSIRWRGVIKAPYEAHYPNA